MKALIWSAPLVGLLVSSAQAFDYVDSRGIRHWNHYGDRGASASKQIVQNPNKPKIEIVQDKVRFVPIEPAPTMGRSASE